MCGGAGGGEGGGQELQVTEAELGNELQIAPWRNILGQVGAGSPG